jgi:hypothetical protein
LTKVPAAAPAPEDDGRARALINSPVTPSPLVQGLILAQKEVGCGGKKIGELEEGDEAEGLLMVRCAEEQGREEDDDRDYLYRPGRRRC